MKAKKKSRLNAITQDATFDTFFLKEVFLQELDIEKESFLNILISPNAVYFNSCKIFSPCYNSMQQRSKYFERNESCPFVSY